MIKDGFQLEFRAEVIERIKNEPGKYLALTEDIPPKVEPQRSKSQVPAEKDAKKLIQTKVYEDEEESKGRNRHKNKKLLVKEIEQEPIVTQI